MAYQNYNQPGFGGFGGVPLNQPVPMLADESGQAGGGMPAGTDPFDWMLFNNTQIPHDLKMQIQQARLSGNNQAMNELIFNSGLPQDFKMQLSQSGAGRPAYQRPPQQPRMQPGQQAPPNPGQGGGPQLGGVGGAPVGGGGPTTVRADGGGGRPFDGGGGGPVYASNDPRAGSGYWDERIPAGGFGDGGGRYGNGPQGPFTQQAPPMYAGTPGETRGGGVQGGKFGGGPQLGMIGGAPVSDRSASGRMLSEGKSNAAPSGQAAGSGKWQYHANGSRTWKPNKPKPAAKPPVVVKPGPGGGPTTQGNTSTRPYETDPPQPNPTISANDVVKPGGTQTPPIYVPGSDMKQSSGSMPSLAASLNKRRPGQ